MHSGKSWNDSSHHSDHHHRQSASVPEEQMRVRKPQPNEIFGIVTALLGGSRLRVNCIDGKERVVRIPGRLKREAWIKVGDVVLVVPWEIDPMKGDVTWRYTKIQVEWLKNRNYLPKNFG
ncbi:MAG: translation initiation factor eIF-1A [Candidatus Micrarchaeota archaeon]|nr:translation initiation factor eIF-1A [Candidatus Micrarchaeota archaeon]